MAVQTETTCVENHKNSLHLLNMVLALVASVLGMAASASYSTSGSTMMSVPFMIAPKYTYVGTKATLVSKGYLGLSGVTYWSHEGPHVKYTFSFADSYNGMNCGTNKYEGMGYVGTNGDLVYPPDKYLTIIGCDGLKQCMQVGKVSMAFVCLGFLMAIVSMVCSKTRRDDDSYSKKIMSVFFSFAALLCSLISFLAYGACVRWFPQSYDPVQDPKPPAACLVQNPGECGSTGTNNFIYPGSGAGLAITGLALFIVIFALNIAIPGYDVALSAAENTPADKI